MLAFCLRLTAQLRDAFFVQMRLVEPLARSCVILAYQMGKRHPLLGPYGKRCRSGASIQRSRGGEITLITDALQRQVGAMGRARTAHPAVSWGSRSGASHLLRHLTAPRDGEGPCSMLGLSSTNHGTVRHSSCWITLKYKETSAAHRNMFLGIFQPQQTYESLIAVLAHDGCTESITEVAHRVSRRPRANSENAADRR